MIKVGLISAGKMGISHLSILDAHPDLDVVRVCDTSKMVLDVFRKYSSFKGYDDYEEFLVFPVCCLYTGPMNLQENVYIYNNYWQ